MRPAKCDCLAQRFGIVLGVVGDSAEAGNGDSLRVDRPFLLGAIPRPAEQQSEGETGKR
jgi:hypothetical protein